MDMAVLSPWRFPRTLTPVQAVLPASVAARLATHERRRPGPASRHTVTGLPLLAGQPDRRPSDPRLAGAGSVTGCRLDQRFRVRRERPVVAGEVRSQPGQRDRDGLPL